MRTARAARELNVSGLLMMREQCVLAYQICLAATMSYPVSRSTSRAIGMKDEKFRCSYRCLLLGSIPWTPVLLAICLRFFR